MQMWIERKSTEFRPEYFRLNSKYYGINRYFEAYLAKWRD